MTQSKKLTAFEVLAVILSVFGVFIRPAVVVGDEPLQGIARVESNSVNSFLTREILGAQHATIEAQRYAESLLREMPVTRSLAEWEKHAQQIREDVLNKIVFRGEAVRWRDAPSKVDWFDTIDGGPEYKIKKLRYEALPGLWIPALLYEPIKLDGKAPVVLNVSGHEPQGKDVDYKQIRCINQAKRGMLALNVEWLGMGQLRSAGFSHYKMNQLDLCGTSGLAPFYLAMSRALDLLLKLPHADPERVAVTGLSGGGWQTIVIGSLDPRIKLANPVAGYSSFQSRIWHLKDTGDSEQLPSDLATVADYTHLTALMAPRPTLLTFNDQDSCCFEAGYALAPLEDAAKSVFRLFGREDAFRTHINREGGTHNYGKDNREAFYRMVGDFFYFGDKTYSADEISCDHEVKPANELTVDLPKDNRHFNRLALELCQDLPRQAELPNELRAAEEWQDRRRKRLKQVVRAKDFQIKAERLSEEKKMELQATYWKLRAGHAWTVPAVEIARGKPKETAILIGDGGRTTLGNQVKLLLDSNMRVLVVDPFCVGESMIQREVAAMNGQLREWKAEPWNSRFAVLIAAIGDRPLGIQASQLAAIARWARSEYREPTMLVAVGPRASAMALVAAGLENKSIGQVKLTDTLGSFKELIELDRGINEMLEMFCFGLLEQFDVRQLIALVAPRPVVICTSTERVRTELDGLQAWYATLGRNFNPLQ